MQIKEVRIKKIWEDFLLSCKEKTFLQSWNWGEFQKKMEDKIWRFGIFQNDRLISVAQILKITARRGAFLFLPHGPVVRKKTTDDEKTQILKVLLDELKRIASEEKVIFIRVSPIWKRKKENLEIFESFSFREAPIHMHPELTWQLDITPSEDELLMGMRKTTRYLIRKALKNRDIKIIKSQNPKDLEAFNQLYKRTAQRHIFVPFSFNYVKNEFLSFQADNQVSVFLGKYKEKILSSGIFIFWSQLAFYHHGASSLEHPKVPDSYLLQWEAIKEAKKRGCKTFNFWGIAPTNKKNHPWAGLSLFKKGFGGERAEYVKTQDLPLSTNYWLIFLFETLRRKKRGL